MNKKKENWNVRNDLLISHWLTLYSWILMKVFFLPFVCRHFYGSKTSNFLSFAKQATAVTADSGLAVKSSRERLCFYDALQWQENHCDFRQSSAAAKGEKNQHRRIPHRRAVQWMWIISFSWNNNSTVGEARKRYSTLCAISHADKGKTSVGARTTTIEWGKKSILACLIFALPISSLSCGIYFFPIFYDTKIYLVGWCAGVKPAERKRKKFFLRFLKSSTTKRNAEEIQFRANKILIRIRHKSPFVARNPQLSQARFMINCEKFIFILWPRTTTQSLIHENSNIRRIETVSRFSDLITNQTHKHQPSEHIDVNEADDDDWERFKCDL